MQFKNEKDFRNNIVKSLYEIDDSNVIRNIYKVENYSGRGLPDILVITKRHNFLLELKYNGIISKIQEYNINSNDYIILGEYRNDYFYLNKNIKINSFKNFIDALYKMLFI